jgi:hypothetical protein
MRSSIGAYTPLVVPSEVITSAPKPVHQLWGKVTSAQRRHNEARDVLRVMEEEAKTAPEADAIAAREAVAKGEPIPPSTVTAVDEGISKKQREIKALADLADDLEATFLNALHGSRDEMIPGFRADAERALDDAVTALQAALEAIDNFTMAASLWNWARADENRALPHRGFDVRVNGGGFVKDQIERSISALLKEHPAEVEDLEAEFRRQFAEMSGRATPDGLIKDRAAYAAYER